jgi:gas vesicle protein
MNSGKVLISVIAGAAVGAIMGVLFAPDKGSATRKKIAKKSADTIDDLKKKVENLMDDIASKYEDGKEEVKEAFQKVKNKADVFSNEANSKVKN